MDSSTLTAPAETERVPGWVQDAVFYQIFPDRFARSDQVPKPTNLQPWESPPTIHGFKGGDLLGVVEHLDHLQDLGITALYFCPVFRSTANHRYHTHDYYEVDPILGGNPALARLLEEAHRRNMRVILDGVFNHASRGFFQFSHILENGAESPYIDWFDVQSWPLRPYGPEDQPPGYRCWWGIRDLPEFKTSTPAVRDFLWGVAQHWIDQGLDGWRLDVPNEIDDDEFWREFRRRVKGANPEAYIVGEIWGEAGRWLAGDQFDAVMNYLFTKACIGFFTLPKGIDQEAINGTGLDPVGPLNVEQFAGMVDWIAGLYPWQNTLAQLNLIDSHDTARFISIARGDESALRLAVLFEMAFPGAPCVYYGDEIGMSGGQTVEEARGAFIWERERWNTDLLDYYRRVIALRHQFAALRRGTFRTVHARDDVYALERRYSDEVVVVAFNSGTQERRVDLDLEGLGLGARLVLGDQAPDLVAERVRNWRIPARSGAVLAGGKSNA